MSIKVLSRSDSAIRAPHWAPYDPYTLRASSFSHTPIDTLSSAESSLQNNAVEEYSSSSETEDDASSPRAQIDPKLQEFLRLPQFTETPLAFPQLFPSALIDPARNRYPHILPFENTRFRIAAEPAFYFNASMVLGGRGIAAQGPLPHEHAEFWKMVWHSGSPVIVMLVNLVERNFNKCSCYWPSQEPLSFENGTFSVSLVAEATNGPIIKRTFLLERDKVKKTIAHFHVTHWPDQEVIDKRDLAELVIEVDRHRAINPSSPILAHCSAGLGRTGVFLATLEGYDRVKKGTATSTLVFDTVSQMRGERSFMVQNHHQYRLIHDTLELLDAITARPQQE